MLLLQPVKNPDGTTAPARRYVVKAQLVSTSGSRDSGDAVRADSTVRVYNVARPPAGFGTLWTVEVEGLGWSVEEVSPARDMRNVVRVTISSTQPSGARG